MMRTLTSLTFIYVQREDRVLAAINAGHPDAWSCWLTRRLALAVLGRTADYLASKSELAQRAPTEVRGELVALERDAAIAKTAGAMSITPPAILNQSATAAELGDRLTISQHRDGFRLELRGQGEGGAAAMLKPAELQRVLQMLQAEVTKAGWLATPVKPQAVQGAAATDTKPVRH
jgi:hypothetical protein